MVSSSSAAMKGAGLPLPTLLVVLSLGALVVAGLAAACSVDDGTADTMIRLPSDRDGVTEEEVVEVGVRPWKCCDKPSCTRSNPPICHCMDTVRRCFSACKHCKEVRPGSHLFRCLDAYRGPPGPKCTQADETNQGVTAGVTNYDQEAVATVPATEAEEEENAVEKRPWKCCNKPSCTRSHPPVCHCMDTVRRCSSDCKRCKEVRPGSHLFRCLDAYEGSPGPKCTQADETDQGVTTDATNDEQEAEATEEVVVPATEAKEEENTTAGKRPWKCCNKPSCTKSRTPICHCMDTVRRCSSACKHCKEVRPGSHLFRCLDDYKGQPGPKCHKDDGGPNAVGGGD